MNKLIVSMAVAFAALCAAFGDGQENVPVTICTRAPATYADGTTVKPGEFFALVWAKTAATEVSFLADGTLAASAGEAELIAAGPWANQEGKLWLPRGYVIPNELKEKGGELRLLTLDTRTADGSLFTGYTVDKANDAVLRETDGRVALPVAVNACDPIAGFALDGAKSAITGVGEIRVSTASALPPNTPQPEIVATRFEGEGANRKMILTVKKTAWYVQYNAAKGAALDALEAKAAEQPQNGKASADETIEIVVPAADDKGFFKVIRN